MSKKKRAERLIGKTIETQYHGPAKVLDVEGHRTVYGNKLCLKLQFQPSRIWPKGRVDWEPVRSRMRYEVIE